MILLFHTPQLCPIMSRARNGAAHPPGSGDVPRAPPLRPPTGEAPLGGGEDPRTARSTEWWDAMESMESERWEAVCSSMFPYCRSLWQKPSRLLWSAVSAASSAAICTVLNHSGPWKAAILASRVMATNDIPKAGASMPCNWGFMIDDDCVDHPGRPL